jgi:cell division protein FtsI (penicillin-binding protein 3)
VAERVAAHEGYSNGWFNQPAVVASKKIPVPQWSGRTLEEASSLSDVYGLNITANGISSTHTFIQNSFEEDSILAAEPIKLQVRELLNPTTKGGYITVPDVRGLSMRQANRALLAVGLRAYFERSGTIYSQFPLPGQKMQKGRTVTLKGKAKQMTLLSAGEGTK